MEFPSSSAITLEDALKTIRERASVVKNLSLSIRAVSSPSWVQTVNYMNGLKAIKTQMATVVAAVGSAELISYAQAQFSGSGIDIVSKYNAMIAQLDSMVNLIASNIPKDGSNRMLVQTIAADGAITDITFNGATLTAFRSAIDGLTATIS
jgi:hypothetical protein